MERLGNRRTGRNEKKKDRIEGSVDKSGVVGASAFFRASGHLLPPLSSFFFGVETAPIHSRGDVVSGQHTQALVHAGIERARAGLWTARKKRKRGRISVWVEVGEKKNVLNRRLELFLR